MNQKFVDVATCSHFSAQRSPFFKCVPNVRKPEFFIIPTYSPILGVQADSGIIGTTCTKKTVFFAATFWLQKICGRCGLAGLSGLREQKPIKKCVFLRETKGEGLSGNK